MACICIQIEMGNSIDFKLEWVSLSEFQYYSIIICGHHSIETKQKKTPAIIHQIHRIYSVIGLNFIELEYVYYEMEYLIENLNLEFKFFLEPFWSSVKRKCIASHEPPSWIKIFKKYLERWMKLEIIYHSTPFNLWFSTKWP